MQRKTCFILNFGPHYRLPIYKSIFEEIGAHFYIGDRSGDILKGFDYSELPGYRLTLKRRNLLGNMYWLGCSVRLVFKNYDKYMLTGEPLCLSNWLILVFARLMGKETISWTHGWYGRERGIKRLIKKVYFGLHSKCMCYNEYGARLLIEQGIKPDKVSVIYNSLDSYRQQQIRGHLCPTDVYHSHFDNENPVVIYCGRIQQSKKIGMLINLVSELKRQGIETNLILVGKDIDGENLQKMVTEHNINSNVWFYGECYEENTLGELFYNADICISPGNVGLTAIHAMTYGCPVITHDDFPNQMPEFETVKPNITGDFFEKDSIESLTEVTKHWLGLSQDKRDAVRQNCYKEIDTKWNIDHQIEILKGIL